MPGAPLLNLSKATKIKDLTFRWKRLSVQWITMTLRTVESKTLRHITIQPTTADTIEETVHQEWQDLDRLLLQFWITHSIRPQVVYRVGRGGKDLRDHVPSLLPELTARGLVDLVEAS